MQRMEPYILSSDAPAVRAGQAAEIEAMFEAMFEGDRIFQPSAFWEHYNRRNVGELSAFGFENAKRTVARNYFTFVVTPINDQFRFLAQHTRVADWPKVLAGLWSLRDEQVKWFFLAFLSVHTKMLWLYAKRHDPDGILSTLSEPPLGNPFDVRMDGKLVSQDLANSVLEYYSVVGGLPAGYSPRVFCELGAGYGRNAFVFLKMFARAKYIVVDIPPALYVSQRYLTELFPEKVAFTFREFGAYDEIRDEFERSQIAFLLPHQANMLPSASVDVFINISSLHEMLPVQIAAYFDLIGRITRGWFYSKQWQVSHNRFDGIVVREEDYPKPAAWEVVFRRVPLVQRAFFETMFKLSPDPGGAR
jgi:putative sugar O-methyltransferase